MRVYLAIYFLILLGAVISLWRADILMHLPVLWLAGALAVAVGLGVVLGLTSGRRPARLE